MAKKIKSRFTMCTTLKERNVVSSTAPSSLTVGSAALSGLGGLGSGSMGLSVGAINGWVPFS